MNCKKCGAFINDKIGICQMCGGTGNNTNNESAEMIKNTVSFEQNQFNTFKERQKLDVYKENKKDNKHLLIYLIIFGILAIIVIFAIFMYQNNVS